MDGKLNRELQGLKFKERVWISKEKEKALCL